MTEIISILMLLTAMFLIWKMVKTITVTVNVNVTAKIPEINVKNEPAPVQFIQAPVDPLYDENGKPKEGPEKYSDPMALLNQMYHGFEEDMNA